MVPHREDTLESGPRLVAKTTQRLFSLQASETDNTSTNRTTSINANSNFSSGRSGTGEAYYFNEGAYYFNIVLVSGSAAVLPNIDSNDAISLDDPSILISKEVVPARRQPRTACSMSWSSTRARTTTPLEPIKHYCIRTFFLLLPIRTGNCATFFILVY